MKHLLQTIKNFSAPTCASCPQATRGVLGVCQVEQLGLLASSKTSQIYKKGQVIYAQGNACQGLHCLYQGKVKVTKIGSDGKEQIIRLATTGDLIGVCALWGETSYRTSAIALDDCVVCLLPRQDVLTLVQTNLQFASSLMKQLSQALNSADERVLNMAYKPVRERLADALLLLKDTYQQTGDLNFSMAISREDLASLVGTAKETASRLLSELKEEGIVAAKGSQITILKADKLLQISTQYA